MICIYLIAVEKLSVINPMALYFIQPSHYGKRRKKQTNKKVTYVMLTLISRFYFTNTHGGMRSWTESTSSILTSVLFYFFIYLHSTYKVETYIFFNGIIFWKLRVFLPKQKLIFIYILFICDIQRDGRKCQILQTNKR